MSIWLGDGFFGRIRNNIIKWWRLTILPVFHLNNNNPATVLEEVKMEQDKVNNASMVILNDQQQEVSKKEALKTDSRESEKDIIARLERERKEEEERKRKEIEETRQKVQEEERIAAILNANRVRLDSFIEEGKAGREKVSDTREDIPEDERAHRDEEMKRAQEIIDRLNREAAMDEAKKQAEIEAAKRQSQEAF